MTVSDPKQLARIAIMLLGSLSFGAWTARATPPSPVPFVGSISPFSVASGGADFTLTVNGTGFVANSVVNFGGTALTTNYVSNAKLTGTVTAALIVHGGAAWITVTNPGTFNRVSNVAFLSVGNSVSTVNYASQSLSVPPGGEPLGITEGDFNGDGILDLAVADYANSEYTIFLGNADGTFQAGQTTAVTSGDDPVGIAVGDFNNDGKLDLVMGDNNSSSMWVYLGNGDGTFQSGILTTTGNVSNDDVVVGDFDGDGNLDVAFASNGENTVSVVLGKGDGTFQTATTYTVDSGTFNIHEADLNGDGYLDLVVSQYLGSDVDILFGKGDGTFQASQSITAGSSVSDVAIADFNGDGYLDLIGAGDNNLYVMLGNGDGTFQAAQTEAVGASSWVIATADFNGDGKMDIAIPNGGSTAIFFGNGDGTFQAPVTFAGPDYIYSVAVGSFGSNGAIGIASLDLVQDAVVVLEQTVSLSPSTFDFGNQALNVASAAQDFTLTNQTALAVNISGISFSGTNGNDFADTTNCGATLASAASCTIHVKFTPDAAGSLSGTLTVTDDAPGGTQTSSLTGTGVSAPMVSLSGTSVAFSNTSVGVASAARSVTLNNTGTATLNVSAVSVSGTDAGDFNMTNTCVGAVLPTANCQIAIVFTPGANGARSALITLTNNAANSPQTIALSGNGATLATADLSASSLTFSGTVVGSTSAAQSVALTNNGNTALTVTGIATSGANSRDFAVTNTCGASVAAGANCAVSATFKPTAAGTRTATIAITDSATSGTQTITLQGTGEDFSMVFTAGTVLAAGTSENLTLTVTPLSGFTGTVALTCSGAPELSTCTVNPTSVTLNGTAAVTSVFTLTTEVGTAAIPVQNVPPTKFPPAAIRLGMWLAALLMLAMVALELNAPKGRTRRPAALSFGVLLLLVSVGMSACIGVTKHEALPTTPAGTYTLTATGTSGSLTHTATIGITVKAAN